MTLRYTLPIRSPTDLDLVASALWSAGALGLWERPDSVVAWFDDRPAIVPPGGAWEDEPDHDWLTLWKQGLEPRRVGALTVAPSWCAEPAHDVVVIDPGQAFGTGEHATTRLCLTAMQDVALQGTSVLDAGTGSGLIAIAAARLGAVRVLGVDSDEQAVTVARANAARNGVEVEIRHADVTDLTDDPFTVVIANLTTTTILSRAPALARLTAERLITSGIATERSTHVAEALGREGLDTRVAGEEDGWAVVIGERP